MPKIGPVEGLWGLRRLTGVVVFHIPGAIFRMEKLGECLQLEICDIVCVCVIYVYIYIIYIYILYIIYIYYIYIIYIYILYIYMLEVKRRCAYITHKQPPANTSLKKKVNKSSNMYSPFPLSYSFAIFSISNLGMGPKPVPHISIIKGITTKRTIHDDHLVSPTL